MEVQERQRDEFENL